MGHSFWVINGLVYEIDGFIDEYGWLQNYNNFNGGDTEFLLND
jgi:hypothetical protein